MKNIYVKRHSSSFLLIFECWIMYFKKFILNLIIRLEGLNITNTQFETASTGLKNKFFDVKKTKCISVCIK